MDNKEFGKILELRTRKFAVGIIKLSISLPKPEEGRVLKNQLSKSGTSVGANYREANRSRSKADFLNKIKISESEPSETVYWLEILLDLKWLEKVKIDKALEEANELLAIYSSISFNTKK